MKTLIKMEPLKKQEKQSKVSTINSSSDLTRKLFEFQSNGLDKIYEQLTKNNSIKKRGFVQILTLFISLQ